MDLGLNGKRALVTGASRGIGFAIAQALADEGASVVLASRDGEACVARAAEISERGAGSATGTACDMGDLDAVDGLAAFALEHLGGVDVLVLNTGGPPFGPVSAVETATWREHFETMVLSVMRLTGHLLPSMRERGWGRILMVTSTGVVEPIPALGISNALRVSLVNWAKTLSFEIAPDGVTINVVMPGRIATERMEQLYRARAESEGITVDAARKAVEESIPAGRVGTVEEFAALAAFLAGESASYITGSAIAVDGGLRRSVL